MFNNFINDCFEKNFPPKKPVDTVKFNQDINALKFELFVDCEKYNTGDVLWNNIQRDIILSLIEDFFVVMHLCSYQTDEDDNSYIETLDEGMGSVYPYYKNEEDEYFIEVMPNDRRLLTKIKNDSLLWEGGYLLHIAAFGNKQKVYKEVTLKDAEFVIHSFYDNLGFEIDVQNMEEYGEVIKEKISKVLENYHIKMSKV